MMRESEVTNLHPLKFYWLYALIALSITNLSGCWNRFTWEYSRANDIGNSSRPMSNFKIVLPENISVFIHLTNHQISNSYDQVLLVPVSLPKALPVVSRYYGHSRAYEEGAKSPEYFVIEILVDSANSLASFNPRKICLIFDEVVCPKKWIPSSRPFNRGSDYGWESDAMCDNSYTRNNVSVERATSINPPEFVLLNDDLIKVMPAHPVCVVLKYPIAPPSPQKKFSLQFGNFFVNGKVTNLPEIKYSHAQLAASSSP